MAGLPWQAFLKAFGRGWLGFDAHSEGRRGEHGLQEGRHETCKGEGLAADWRAPLQNVSSRPGFDVLDLLMKFMPKRPRTPGPDRLCDVAPSAIARWQADPSSLPEGTSYRPKPLSRLARQLGAPASASAAPPTDVPPVEPMARAGAHYTVRRGDTLRAIALHVYGHADRATAIFEANRSILDEPDRIYIGQILYVP